MFRCEDINLEVYDHTMIKATPLASLKIGDILFEPKACSFPKRIEKHLERIAAFEVREGDVWIISFPKSGTTWTQEMCWLILNNFDFDTAKSVDTGIRCNFLEFSCISDVPIDSIEKAEKLKSPRFLHSHLPLHFLPRELWTKNPKIIYVVRDPRDVVVSLYEQVRHWKNLAMSKDDFCKAFANNQIICTPYFDHVLQFWKLQNQSNILFLTYEEMISNLEAVILRACKFLKKTISSEQLKQLLEYLSFDSMRNNKACHREFQRQLCHTRKPGDTYRFIRRGIVGSYKDELSPELITYYKEWMQKNLKNTEFDLFHI